MNLENNKTLLVGLWNPQSKYLKTRHNIGADILEKFCTKNSIELKLDKSGSFKIGKTSVENSNIDIIFPMVSMNNSGEALKAYLKYSNVEASNILVIHDDIDLGFGRLRLKSGSSDGGHNGIKSINSYLQSNEYFRLKVGVGRPPKGVNPADFVLSKFYNNEEGIFVGNVEIVIVGLTVCTSPPSSFTPTGVPIKLICTSASTVFVRSI